MAYWRNARLLLGFLAAFALAAGTGAVQAQETQDEKPAKSLEWLLGQDEKPQAEPKAPQADTPPSIHIYEPPQELILCGERVPLNLPFVAEQLDREFTIAVYDQAQVVMWLKRAHRYFPYISEQLKKAGLPDDLKYLAVAESALLRKARSWAGAAGLWQFIADTGKRYGLKRDRWFDDRLNPEKSTHAAIAYLTDLHEEFKSWPLAMAAYNCGERRVRREIKVQGVNDYYNLYLPDETMRYVFRIMAAKIVLSDPGRYGYALPKGHLYQPVPADRVTLDLKRPLHLRTLAQACSTTVRRLKELNPELRDYYLPSGHRQVKVPKGQGQGLSARLARVKPAPPPARSVWVVKSGETLSSIARKNGVKIDELRKANRIKGSAIKPGQRLVIPQK